jgi:deoxycytidylate deaminase
VLVSGGSALSRGPDCPVQLSDHLLWLIFIYLSHRARSPDLPQPSLARFLDDDDAALYGVRALSDPSQPDLNHADELVEANKTASSLLPIPADSHALVIPPPLSPSPSSPSPSPTGRKKSAETRIQPLAHLMRRAHLILSNHSHSLDDLYKKLDDIDIAGQEIGELLRPGWDEYFMCLAGLASLRSVGLGFPWTMIHFADGCCRSNCMKRRVGAVLVSPNYRVISTGYNGTPRGTTNCNQGARKYMHAVLSFPVLLTDRGARVQAVASDAMAREREEQH